MLQKRSFLGKLQPSHKQFNIVTENVPEFSHRKGLIPVTARDKKDCYLGITWKGKGKKQSTILHHLINLLVALY